MRDLIRNQVEFWYSVYLDKEPVLKNGFETGQYREVYSEPIRARARISSAKGETDSEIFGTSVKYDRVISSVRDFPINEFSRLWIDVAPSTGAKPDYAVKRVAKGLDQNLWAIERVTRNADETD